MKTRLQSIACLSCLVLASGLFPLSAQLGDVGSGDARVSRLLEALGLKWTIDNDGDFRMHNEVGDGRSQLIWVLSNTSQLKHLEVREIWSIGYQSDQPFSADIARRLLIENTETKVGAWQMRKMGDKYAAVFSAQIAANTNAETLEAIVDAVSVTADNFEEDVLGTDDW